MTLRAAAETEFNAWYDAQHIPALARVPGASARLFKDGGPRYVALYHLSAGASVLYGRW
jgi:hypothetical protein